ncbi:hypothetical protein [Methylotenera sp.]|uniref:hypothetical protein n=1 Tax=Methylotenera sp. TaxID=2051956 RepID=UPI00248791E8|nr:hypothetical protein [Methylotenera sp.]MDI1361913.1 hypothetical protein [Methylotenera sp.]
MFTSRSFSRNTTGISAVAVDLKSKTVSFHGWWFNARISRPSFSRGRESSLGGGHECVLIEKLLVFTLPRFPPTRE